MAKKTATKQTTPVNLGTKRACPKCSAKFYDFGKDELVCPKCGEEFDVETLAKSPILVVPSAPKKAPVKVLDEEQEESTTSSEFESLDELEDSDEEEIVEDLDVVDKKDDEDF